MPLTRSEADKIIDVIKGCVGPVDRFTKPEKADAKGAGKAEPEKRVAFGDGSQQTLGPGESVAFVPVAGLSADDMERLYRAFKSRILEEMPMDPVLLHLLATRPEVEVLVEPRRVEHEGKSLKGRLAKLIADGFLDEPRTASAINKELNRTGGEVNSGNLARALSDFKSDGLLTLEAADWRRAPGVKVTTRTVESA